MATKNKTNRSLKKRFKITATGKLKHSHAKRRHLLAGRTSKSKRHPRKPDDHHRADGGQVHHGHGRAVTAGTLQPNHEEI